MTPHRQGKSSHQRLLHSHEKWGELQYTHMFRTFTLRTKRGRRAYVWTCEVGRWSCIKWENDCDCSSRQANTFDCFFDERVCVVENNKRVERKWWQRLFIYLWRGTTTIINSFAVCLLCLSENHHHHYNHYSTLIIFKREPSAMQMPMSLNTR